MNLDITIDDRDIVQALREVERNLDRIMPEAVTMAGDAVAARAREVHDYEDISGQLTNSIMVGGVEGSFTKGSLQAEVAAGAPHGIYIEEGTEDHEVKPKHRKALRWPVEGGFAFSKGHIVSGIREREFLKNALEHELDDLTEELAAAAELAFVEAGL